MLDGSWTAGLWCGPLVATCQSRGLALVLFDPFTLPARQRTGGRERAQEKEKKR